MARCRIGSTTQPTHATGLSDGPLGALDSDPVRGVVSTGWCFFPFRSAVRARADLPQILKGIDPGRVAVSPIDLEGVAPHQFGTFRFQGFRAEHGEGVVSGRGPNSQFWTVGARAFFAQVTVGVNAQVAIRPLDGKRIISARESDLGRIGLQGRFAIPCPLSVVHRQLQPQSTLSNSPLKTDNFLSLDADVLTRL